MRIPGYLPNAVYFERVREYWKDPRYIINLPVFRQICYEPLEGTIQDLDIALYWICQEAAIDLEYNLEVFHSAKLWMLVTAHYESANPEAPNAKQFNAELHARATIIGYFPLTVHNYQDPLRPYREALRILADRVLQFHARFIRKESGFVLTEIIKCIFLS